MCADTLTAQVKGRLLRALQQHTAMYGSGKRLQCFCTILSEIAIKQFLIIKLVMTLIIFSWVVTLSEP